MIVALPSIEVKPVIPSGDPFGFNGYVEATAPWLSVNWTAIWLCSESSRNAPSLNDARPSPWATATGIWKILKKSLPNAGFGG